MEQDIKDRGAVNRLFSHIVLRNGESSILKKCPKQASHVVVIEPGQRAVLLVLYSSWLYHPWSCPRFEPRSFED
jgi:hypothetical protein